MRKILLVDDDPNVAEVIEQYFDRSLYDVCTMLRGEKVPETALRIKPDLILLDLTLPDVNGIDVLKNLKQTGSQAPVVIITGNVSAETAMETMKEGAYEYLPKPFSLDELGKLVDKLLAKDAGASMPSGLPQPGPYDRPKGLVGRSPEMLKIGKIIGQAALSSAPILLCGENGTGKELVARLIHQNSAKKDNPFLVVNCSYLSPEMLEKELYGPGEGQSGSAGTAGEPVRSDTGTVFLDGVESMGLEAQARLLRFLRAGHGSSRGEGVGMSEVRVIASCSADLSEKVSQDTFMQELFYSLRVISIHIPALRERRSDIPLLAEHFLRRYCEQNGKTISAISADAMKLLLGYAWPGNVEELENNIYSAVVMCQNDQILPEHLPLAYPHSPAVSPDWEKLQGDYSRLFLQSLEPLKSRLFDDLKGEIHNQLMGSLEKALIFMALAECDGNQVKASGLLGISRNTLREKMVKFGLLKKEGTSQPTASISRSTASG
jgi:DNA-binding NtrC family response regulator